MLNSKYSKVLTVILIISIIIIAVLLVIVGINYYKIYTTNADVDDFSKEFEDYISGNVTSGGENENNEVADNTVITPDLPEDLYNNEAGSSGSSGGGSTKDPLTYKGFTVLGKIEIPKTKVKYYLLKEYSDAALATSICVIYGPGVNEPGNTVLAGHNYRNGTFFSNNKKLAKGDKIYITDLTGTTVTYEISNTYLTDEHDFKYAVRDTEGKRAISLTTCTDDTKNRLIILAEEV